MKIKATSAVKKAETAQSKTQAKAVASAIKKVAPATPPVTFSVRAEPGSKVFLAGTFNNWNPTAMVMTDDKGDGVYTATLYLPAGAHAYKFVIDGTWCADPECADCVQNEHGTLNSLKHVN